MTIILLHGAPSLPSVWEPLLPFLPEGTRTPELLDSRDGAGSAATLSEALDDITEQCLAVAGPLTLVGHSSAAWLALRIAERHPERVKRTVCLAGCANMPEGHGKEMLGFAEALESGALSLESASQIASERWFERDANYERHTLAARKLFLDMGLGGTARALRRSFEMIELPGLKAHSIAEIVVIHGTRDQAVPLALGQAAKPAAQSYREVLLDTASHFLQWSHPEAVASAVLG